MLILLLKSDLFTLILDKLSPCDIFQLLKIIKCTKLTLYFQNILKKIVIIKPLKCLIYQYPFIFFNSTFLGNTGYLDGIRHRHLSYPIMVGYDNNNRWFISVKYKCLENWEYDGKPVKKSDKIWCLTIFQRYIQRNSWYQCGQGSKTYGAPLLYNCPVCLDNNDLELFTQNISRLINKRPIIYYDYLSKKSMIPTEKKFVKCQLIV